MNEPEQIAIIGGGPSGSTLACLLAREGLNVGVFQPEKTASIMVGESMVPAVIPILRRLGVEEQIKSIGRFKPGASFFIKGESAPTFTFDDIPSDLPPYAYNVPRKEFDRALLENAIRAGAEHFPFQAEIETTDNHERVELSSELPDHVFDTFDGQPDLIVDATGRARLLPNALDLPSEEVGHTRGAALFTHLDDMKEADDGNVHTEVFDGGWAWRIPLRDRVSFGIVTANSYMDEVGDTNEERLTYFLNNVPRLRALSENSERIEPIYRFDNYQLITNRIHGPNWTLLGDTAGFIDPVFSTGLYLAMNSAETLASKLTSHQPMEQNLQEYEQKVLHELSIWQDVIKQYYNGRLLALIDTGEEVKNSFLGRLINTHLERHLGRIFTGAASNSWYSIKLMSFMCKYALRDRDPDAYQVF